MARSYSGFASRKYPSRPSTRSARGAHVLACSSPLLIDRGCGPSRTASLAAGDSTDRSDRAAGFGRTAAWASHLLFESGDRDRLLSVTAIPEGHDPPLAHREHRVVAIVRLLHAKRVEAPSPDHDHDPVTACDDLFQLRPQAALSLALQDPLELVAAVADLRLRVLEAGVEVGPLQIRIDELEHCRHVASGVRLVHPADQVLVFVRHQVLSFVVAGSEEMGAEAPRREAALEPGPDHGRLDDDGRQDRMVGGLGGHPTGPLDGVSGAFRLSRRVASATSIERTTRAGKARLTKSASIGLAPACPRSASSLGDIMRTIRDASEDEVVAAFLQAEIDSERHAQDPERAACGRSAQIDRRLTGFRRPRGERVPPIHPGTRAGQGRGERMFQGFPGRVVWALAALAPRELADVRYIAWDWWLERSGVGRLATEYARRIRAGAFPGDPESGLRYHEPIARRLREGPPLPRLIVVRDAARPDFLVLVEGHVRVTAFFLFPEMLPPELEIYLGTAEGLHSWWPLWVTQDHRCVDPPDKRSAFYVRPDRLEGVDPPGGVVSIVAPARSSHPCNTILTEDGDGDRTRG